jgi:hypothetical protein
LQEQSTNGLSLRAIDYIWTMMTKIYREKWSADTCYGEHVDHDGNLSLTAKDWQQFLAGLTDQQIKTGINVTLKKAEAWPPNVMEFKKYCLSRELEGVPTINEVYSILAFNKNKEGSIKDRYKHPLVFYISQNNDVDMQKVRGDSRKVAIESITTVYNRFIQKGWPDWKPEHLLNPLLIEQKKAGKEQWNKNFANLREQIRLR